ncbi:MotE family protein [Acidomonas methanolica]|uniref:MotE family protein n=1 Tax=Acidomonas methanolica TaxID=437 RepID=UPI002119C77F|nr:hypothetical protein [Acidomonas methanolica]MCQ9155471.1 hypothetical protein [Acidomonas methanolica]
MGWRFRFRLGLAKVVPVATSFMVVALAFDIVDIVRSVSGKPQASVVGNFLIERANADAQMSPAPGDAPSATRETLSGPTTPATTGRGQGSEKCAGGGVCNGKAPPRPAEPGMQELVTDIVKQREIISAESKAIAEQKRLIDAATLVLDQRVKVGAAGNAATGATSKPILTPQDAARLTAIYEAMRPADAAAIFDILDLHVGVALLGNMAPRRASAIMAQMSPQRAILATQMLARRQPLLIPVSHDGG